MINFISLSKDGGKLLKFNLYDIKKGALSYSVISIHKDGTILVGTPDRRDPSKIDYETLTNVPADSCIFLEPETPHLWMPQGNSWKDLALSLENIFKFREIQEAPNMRLGILELLWEAYQKIDEMKEYGL